MSAPPINISRNNARARLTRHRCALEDLEEIALHRGRESETYRRHSERIAACLATDLEWLLKLGIPHLEQILLHGTPDHPSRTD